MHRTLRRETFHTIYRGYARSAAIASIVAAGLIFLAGCGAPEPADRNASDTEAPRLIPDAAGKPNVVVILIDTLRADYLGAYGHEPETAPFLNRIAEQSALFTRAFSTSSWTAPSTASLFTGTYPLEHGITRGLRGNKLLNEKLASRGEATIQLNHIRSETVTLPEHFSANGYRTFGAASNRNVGKPMGFASGFDHFFPLYEKPAEFVFEQILQWKRVMVRAQPYFFYLHLNDVHEPYLEREPYFGHLAADDDDARRRYLSEIGYVDAYIERIYETLNMANNTVLVVLSDHGEEFSDHGRRQHGARLYREVNQIVMMIHSPHLKIPPGQIDANVSIIDVLPTLLEICEFPPAEAVQGRSLAPLLWGGEAAGTLADSLSRRTLFAHRVEIRDEGHEHWAAMFQHWKLYEPWAKPPELYDHRVDFGEQHNLFGEQTEVARMLTERLAAFKETAGDHSDTLLDLPVDRELLESLETLGYIE